MRRTRTFADYLHECDYEWKANPQWRWGQTLFNVLYAMKPSLADRIRGERGLDPFYADGVASLTEQRFLAYVQEHWDDDEPDA